MSDDNSKPNLLKRPFSVTNIDDMAVQQYRHISLSDGQTVLSQEEAKSFLISKASKVANNSGGAATHPSLQNLLVEQPTFFTSMKKPVSAQSVNKNDKKFVVPVLRNSGTLSAPQPVGNYPTNSNTAQKSTNKNSVEIINCSVAHSSKMLLTQQFNVFKFKGRAVAPKAATTSDIKSAKQTLVSSRGILPVLLSNKKKLIVENFVAKPAGISNSKTGNSTFVKNGEEPSSQLSSNHNFMKKANGKLTTNKNSKAVRSISSAQHGRNDNSMSQTVAKLWNINDPLAVSLSLVASDHKLSAQQHTDHKRAKKTCLKSTPTNGSEAVNNRLVPSSRKSSVQQRSKDNSVSQTTPKVIDKNDSEVSSLFLVASDRRLSAWGSYNHHLPHGTTLEPVINNDLKAVNKSLVPSSKESTAQQGIGDNKVDQTALKVTNNNDHKAKNLSFVVSNKKPLTQHLNNCHSTKEATTMPVDKSDMKSGNSSPIPSDKMSLSEKPSCGDASNVTALKSTINSDNQTTNLSVVPGNSDSSAQDSSNDLVNENTSKLTSNDLNDVNLTSAQSPSKENPVTEITAPMPMSHNVIKTMNSSIVTKSGILSIQQGSNENQMNGSPSKFLSLSDLEALNLSLVPSNQALLAQELIIDNLINEIAGKPLKTNTLQIAHSTLVSSRRSPLGKQPCYGDVVNEIAPKLTNSNASLSPVPTDEMMSTQQPVVNDAIDDDATNESASEPTNNNDLKPSNVSVVPIGRMLSTQQPSTDDSVENASKSADNDKIGDVEFCIVPSRELLAREPRNDNTVNKTVPEFTDNNVVQAVNASPESSIKVSSDQQLNNFDSMTEKTLALTNNSDSTTRNISPLPISSTLAQQVSSGSPVNATTPNPLIKSDTQEVMIPSPIVGNSLFTTPSSDSPLNDTTPKFTDNNDTKTTHISLVPSSRILSEQQLHSEFSKNETAPKVSNDDVQSVNSALVTSSRLLLAQNESTDNPVTETAPKISDDDVMIVKSYFIPTCRLRSEKQPCNNGTVEIDQEPTKRKSTKNTKKHLAGSDKKLSQKQARGDNPVIRDPSPESHLAEMSSITDDMIPSFSEPSTENWQATKFCVKERFAFLFNNVVLSDISFVVGDKAERQCIPGHKLVLSASSAVFATMFSENRTFLNNEVHVLEVKPTVFLEFLRYLYTDNVSITLDNVVEVMHVSKMYAVAGLVNTCVDFFRNNLCPRNAFTLLVQAKRFDDQDLVVMCQRIIDRNTAEALLDEGFLHIDLNTLCSFLKGNTLNIPEIQLFEATCRWSEAACKRRDLPLTPANQQTVLGEALSLIRYPLMSPAEFSSKVALSGILPERDTISVYHYLTTDPKPSTKFNIKPRISVTHFARRFASISYGWIHGEEEADRIGFSADRDIQLIGFVLFSSELKGKDYRVEVKLVESSTSKLLCHECFAYKTKGSSRSVKAVLKRPVQLSKAVNYTSIIKTSGPESYFGERGIMSNSFTLSNGENVTITYNTVEDGTSNKTTLERGQIGGIIFTV